MAKIQNTDKNKKLTPPNFGEDAEHQELSFISGENSQWFSLTTHTLAVLSKLNIVIPYVPTVTS